MASIPIARIAEQRIRLVLTDEHASSSYGRFVVAVQHVYRGECDLGAAYGETDSVPEAGGMWAGTLVQDWVAGRAEPVGLRWYSQPASERRAAAKRFLTLPEACCTSCSAGHHEEPPCEVPCDCLCHAIRHPAPPATRTGPYAPFGENGSEGDRPWERDPDWRER